MSLVQAVEELRTEAGMHKVAGLWDRAKGVVRRGSELVTGKRRDQLREEFQLADLSASAWKRKAQRHLSEAKDITDPDALRASQETFNTIKGKFDAAKARSDKAFDALRREQQLVDRTRAGLAAGAVLATTAGAVAKAGRDYDAAQKTAGLRDVVKRYGELMTGRAADRKRDALLDYSRQIHQLGRGTPKKDEVQRLRDLTSDFITESAKRDAARWGTSAVVGGAGGYGLYRAIRDSGNLDE